VVLAVDAVSLIAALYITGSLAMLRFLHRAPVFNDG
jgi:hypothetical protein